jgi:hypothetical protein
MDLDALHRHMAEFKAMKPRLLKMLEFVEGIMTSGMMPNTTAQAPTTQPDETLTEQLGAVTDRIGALEAFQTEASPALDKLPAVLTFMDHMEGVDFAAFEERMTTLEGSVQEIAAALDPKGEELPTASTVVPGGTASSDGDAEGQGAAPVASAEDEATEQPAAGPAAPAAS